jgi:hypothetical protein
MSESWETAHPAASSSWWSYCTKTPFIMLIQRHSEICEKTRGSASDLETFVVKGSVDVEGARARMWLVYMYKGPFSGLRCGSR